MLKALGFNYLIVHPFQDVGFNLTQPAPLHVGPWPLMADVREVHETSAAALSKCSPVFVNGFVFDELRPSVVASAIVTARANGAGVFFDPGPKGPLGGNPLG